MLRMPIALTARKKLAEDKELALYGSKYPTRRYLAQTIQLRFLIQKSYIPASGSFGRMGDSLEHLE